MTFTKERLQEIAEGGFLKHGESKELARMALAALEAEPVAWRYRYVKNGVADSEGAPWVGDWKYMPTKEDCNDRPSYEIQALYTAPPAPVSVPDIG